MNHTKSGAIAVGASMSRARIISEIEYCCSEGRLYKLNDTEEGKFIVELFHQHLGQDCGVPKPTVESCIDSFCTAQLRCFLFGWALGGRKVITGD